MAIVTGKGLGQAEVALLAKTFKVAFPCDYADFLTTYNGFRVVAPSYCNLPFDPVDNGFISFDALFGHGHPNPNFDMCAMNDELLDELSCLEHAVVIGADPGGNYYVLIMEGQQAGVYYWDRSWLHIEDAQRGYDLTGDEQSQHLYRVAGSFQQFFDRLLALTVQKGMSLRSELG